MASVTMLAIIVCAAPFLGYIADYIINPYLHGGK